MIDRHHNWNTSVKPQIIGFVISVVLTVFAYFLAFKHMVSGVGAMLWILGIACVQGLVQMVCFMQLGIEKKPRWNFMMFWFMVLVMFVVVGGTMWIMKNLDYNVMIDMKK